MPIIAPQVSVIVANRNGERHLTAALRSILRQTLTAIEVIVVDDASTDGSVALVEDMRGRDARLRLVRRATPGGPSAARNDALRVARGDWVAIVDADDLIARDRLQTLLRLAEADGADIIADDLLLFHDDGSIAPSRMLSGRLAESPSWIDAVDYVQANQLLSRRPQLGYLKPLIRRAALLEHGVTYDEKLRIAEDYDLILRLLVAGCRLRLHPLLTYFYRRHSRSISHRLPDGALMAMAASDGRLRAWAGGRLTPALRAALNARLISIGNAAAVDTAMVALKDHAPGRLLRGLSQRPGAVPAFLRVAADAVGRRLPRLSRSRGSERRPSICVISRQRLSPDGNGSSAYLMQLCEALRRAGWTLHLISPTAATFGRLPFVKVGMLAPTFETMAFRGGLRLGPWLIASSPRVYLGAALGMAARMLRAARLPSPAAWDRPAPYAMAVPWTAEDLLFVARHAQGRADAVVADYAFCLPAASHVLSPDSPVAVVMHDLFFARADNFAQLGAVDSAAHLDLASEADLLRRADLIVAIQEEEGRTVRQMVPAVPDVVVAPMAVTPVAAPQPGEGAGVFFVGSGTAPNVDAMRWFLNEVWPLLLERRPNAQLSIAGNVCGALAVEAQRPGVILLGRVPGLADFYRRADVVISPLRAGSGLKIKLVEALAAGKPIIASPVTLQGVDTLVGDAVQRAETADEFVAAMDHLLGDAASRAALATRALAAAEAHFSADVAFRPLVETLRQRMAAQPIPERVFAA